MSSGLFVLLGESASSSPKCLADLTTGAAELPLADVELAAGTRKKPYWEGKRGGDE